jgi:hypothetical protein
MSLGLGGRRLGGVTEESHVRVPLGAGAPRSNCVREDELAQRFAQVAIPGFPKRISQGVLGGRALGSMAPTVFFLQMSVERRSQDSSHSSKKQIDSHDTMGLIIRDEVVVAGDEELFRRTTGPRALHGESN